MRSRPPLKSSICLCTRWAVSQPRMRRCASKPGLPVSPASPCSRNIDPMTPTSTAGKLGFLLRVGVFALIAILGYVIFPVIITFFLGNVVLVVAAIGTFAAAAVANVIALRIYERGQLTDIGLGWTAASRHNLALGLAGGIGAGLIV